MKILFDHQTFKLQKFGGISRYFTELISEIKTANKHQAICPIVGTDNIHYNEKIGNKTKIWDTIKLLLLFKFTQKRIDRYQRRQNLKNVIGILKSKKFDLFVPTYYDNYFLPFLGTKPFVLNVYDMIHEIYPQFFIPDDLAVKHKAELLQKATKIIAISESTKRDILKFHPNIAASKIAVVHLSHSLVSEKILDLTLPENYILFVGNRWHYKNFIFFFEAIADILTQNENLHLVCAGGDSFTSEELALIDKFSLQKQVIQQNFKDFELATYYKKAKCFVFPSAYEGFGIPVLEAMSCGCAVILANHSSFPEVAGDAGIYFKLDDKLDLKEKVSAMVFDDDLRNNFIEKGLIQAKKFSWQKTTNACMEVFNSVLKN